MSAPFGGCRRRGGRWWSGSCSWVCAGAAWGSRWGGVPAGAPRGRVPGSAGAPAGWPSPEGRRQYVPVAVEADGPVVRPSHVRGSGSHLIASLHLADALALVGAERTRVEAGDRLELMEV